MFSVFWWMLFNSMFEVSAESKSEKSDHKVGKVGSLINSWEITNCSMHRTFTGKSLQLKLRSVCCHPPRNSPSSHYRPRGHTLVTHIPHPKLAHRRIEGVKVNHPRSSWVEILNISVTQHYPVVDSGKLTWGRELNLISVKIASSGKKPSLLRIRNALTGRKSVNCARQ